MNYFRDRDGQPVRRDGQGPTEVLLPNGKWNRFAVDIAHDAVARTLDEATNDAKRWVSGGVVLPGDLR